MELEEVRSYPTTVLGRRAVFKAARVKHTREVCLHQPKSLPQPDLQRLFVLLLSGLWVK